MTAIRSTTKKLKDTVLVGGHQYVQKEALMAYRSLFWGNKSSQSRMSVPEPTAGTEPVQPPVLMPTRAAKAAKVVEPVGRVETRLPLAPLPLKERVPASAAGVAPAAGWTCPNCHRSFSPSTPECRYCNTER